jgi:hypothetical protein
MSFAYRRNSLLVLLAQLLWLCADCTPSDSLLSGEQTQLADARKRRKRDQQVNDNHRGDYDGLRPNGDGVMISSNGPNASNRQLDRIVNFFKNPPRNVSLSDLFVGPGDHIPLPKTTADLNKELGKSAFLSQNQDAIREIVRTGEQTAQDLSDQLGVKLTISQSVIIIGTTPSQVGLHQDEAYVAAIATLRGPPTLYYPSATTEGWTEADKNAEQLAGFPNGISPDLGDLLLMAGTTNPNTPAIWHTAPPVEEESVDGRVAVLYVFRVDDTPPSSPPSGPSGVNAPTSAPPAGSSGASSPP